MKNIILLIAFLSLLSACGKNNTVGSGVPEGQIQLPMTAFTQNELTQARPMSEQELGQRFQAARPNLSNMHIGNRVTYHNQMTLNRLGATCRLLEEELNVIENANSEEFTQRVSWKTLSLTDLPECGDLRSDSEAWYTISMGTLARSFQQQRQQAQQFEIYTGLYQNREAIYIRATYSDRDGVWHDDRSLIDPNTTLDRLLIKSFATEHRPNGDTRDDARVIRP